MMIKAKLTALFIALSAASAAHGQQWTEVKTADNGSYYTGVKSSSRQDNELVVYANPRQDCAILVTVFDFFWNNVNAAGLNGKRMQVHSQYKIDSHSNWDARETAHSVDHYVDSGLTVAKFETFVPVNFINEMITGTKVIFRVKTTDGWGDTMRYPLNGSRDKLDQLLTKCHGSRPTDEWGEDEWTS